MDTTEKHGAEQYKFCLHELKKIGGHIFIATFISSLKIIYQKIVNQHMFSLEIHFHVEDISRISLHFFL